MKAEEAESAPAALMIVYSALERQETFHLAVIELQLPGMSGEVLGRAIRSDERLAHMQMVMLASTGAHCTAEQARQSGFQSIVPKPVQLQELRLALLEAAAPVFDRMGMMQRMMDDESLATAVLAAFLEDMPRQLARLQKMLTNEGDAAACGRQAHSIKGAAGNVGGERFRQLAACMEKAADRGDWEKARGEWARLHSGFTALKEAIQREFFLQ
jgi:HPt (histidine-containing phosphotransfer) domain-containing protein